LTGLKSNPPASSKPLPAITSAGCKPPLKWLLNAASNGPLSWPTAKQAVSSPALRWLAWGASSRERCITNCMQARNGVPHKITPSTSPGPLPSRQAKTPADCIHKVSVSH